jgi:hypothetical protein
VTVSRHGGARLRLAGGATVALPENAVSRDGHLTGSVVTAPSSAGLVTLLGSAYHFEVQGARLTGTATVSLPVSAPPSPESPVFLAYFEPSAGHWTLVASRYNARTKTVTGTTPHLSTWGLVTIDPTALKAGLEGIVKGFFGVPDAAQPACSGSAGQAGVKVTSSSGSLVKWCAGPAADAVAGGTTVRIVNNHGFAVEADYPVSWTVKRLGAEEDWKARLLEDTALGLSPQPVGQSAIVVPGGGEIELHVAAGQGGTVSTRVSGPAVLGSAFLLGIQVLAATFDRLPWWPKSSPSKLDQVVNALSTSHDCASSAEGLARSDPRSPSGVGEAFRSDVDFVFGCLKSAWETAYEAKGALATALISIVLLAADAVITLVDAVAATVDAIRYFAGYQIVLQLTSEPVPPAGSVAAITPHAEFSSSSGIIKAGSAYWFAAATESATAIVTAAVYRWNGSAWQRQAAIPIVNKDGTLASGGLNQSEPITVRPLTNSAAPDFLIHSNGADTNWLNVVSDATGRWAAVPFDDSGGQTLGENMTGISGGVITVGYDSCVPDCATGHVTTVRFQYASDAFVPVDPPGSCTGEALAQSAHASAPSGSGQSDFITAFTCANGYAAATASNGNYGWTITFKSSETGWKLLVSGNIMPTTGIPTVTYQALQHGLSGQSQDEYYPY